MLLKKFVKNEYLVTFLFILPAIFWLILAIVNIGERNLYTKVKLIPLPFIIHAVSVVGMCLMYLYIFLLSTLKNAIFRAIIATSFGLLFMATYEFFYWLFLISNLNFDLSRMDYFALPDPELLTKKLSVDQLPLKFFKISILTIIILALFLWFVNKKNTFLSIRKVNIYFSLIIFIIFLIVMIILRQQGFFVKTLFWFRGLLHENPHNLLWALSKFLAMLMFLPLIKTKIKLNND